MCDYNDNLINYIMWMSSYIIHMNDYTHSTTHHIKIIQNYILLMYNDFVSDTCGSA